MTIDPKKSVKSHAFARRFRQVLRPPKSTSTGLKLSLEREEPMKPIALSAITATASDGGLCPRCCPGRPDGKERYDALCHAFRVSTGD